MVVPFAWVSGFGLVIVAPVLHAEAGHLPIGTRARLVDAVLDLPSVQLSDHLQACAPVGDSESMNEIRQRTTDMRTHAAGYTAIIDTELIGPGEVLTTPCRQQHFEHSAQPPPL